ncbi:hypothetical protein IMSAG192_01303 [Muribaculaceae bacterium]|nr:hypothetical protein IMSAG192_01303 [Muribaculaceae bacterium]
MVAQECEFPVEPRCGVGLVIVDGYRHALILVEIVVGVAVGVGKVACGSYPLHECHCGIAFLAVFLFLGLYYYFGQLHSCRVEFYNHLEAVAAVYGYGGGGVSHYAYSYTVGL